MTKRSPAGSRFAIQNRLRWEQQYNTPDINQQAEQLAARRDMVTLLTYVRDNKVVGTQSRGNLPLKAVREVTARFVNPPQLDTTIGERTYRLRTEMDVWPLYFLHIMAEVGQLVKTAPARRWQLTAGGETFLNATALNQVMYLFTVWWNNVNWLVAYPVSGLGESLPYSFAMLTLRHLQETCAVGEPVSYEAFADGLLEKTGLAWVTPDSPYARMSLHHAIRRMVIDVLETFGGVRCVYQETALGPVIRADLHTIELTPFGRALLDAVSVTGAG